METQHQNQQTVTERHLTISTKPGSGPSLPDIRVGGRWLEQAGFNIGNTVTLSVEHGRIVIVADEEPYQKPCDPIKDEKKRRRELNRWKNWRTLNPGPEQDAWFRGARSPEEAAALPKFRKFPASMTAKSEREKLAVLQQQLKKNHSEGGAIGKIAGSAG